MTFKSSKIIKATSQTITQNCAEMRRCNPTPIYRANGKRILREKEPGKIKTANARMITIRHLKRACSQRTQHSSSNKAELCTPLATNNNTQKSPVATDPHAAHAANTNAYNQK